MSEQTIAYLQAENTRLNKALADTSAEAKKYRIDRKRLKGELDELTGKHAELVKDRDAWQGKAKAAPSDLQAKVDELTGKLLDRDHRDSFRALYDDTSVGLNPGVKVETLWQVLGYKPEGEPDAAAIRATVEGAKAAHPYLFAQPGGGSPPADPGGSKQPTGRPPLVVANPDGGRGARDKAGVAVRVRKQDLQSPAFTLDPKNRAMLKQAREAGTLEVID